MKKNRENAKLWNDIKRKLLIMKLTAILVFILSIQAFASTFGQSAKFSLSVKNETFSEVIKQLEKQSDFLFVLKYDQNILDKKISLDFKDASIEQVLTDLLEGTNLSYKIIDKYIAIADKEAMNQGARQWRMVKGTVSGANGEPIPGATVLVKGTTVGTVTDFDGNFQLNVPDNNTVLVFSFIGFVSQQIQVDGQNEFKVVLIENVESISEVVVTAMNINRNKQSLGYSLTALSGNEFTQAKETNMVNSLKGKVAGLSIMQTAGGVGGSNRIVLRGVSSLSGSNSPLFVIDGVAMGDNNNPGGGSKGKDMGNAISEIDPENIESISVLKGAGASAAYGSRGANGVILITTKKGRQNGFGVSITSNFDIDQPVLYTNLQNTYGQGAMGMYPPIDATTNMPAKSNIWSLSFGPKMEGQMLPNFAGKIVPFSPQPNNVLDYFRMGSTFTNSVTIDSGNEKANVLLSLSNVDSKGISPGNDLSRQSINLRGTMKVGTRLELDSKISYIHQTVENRVYMEETAGNAMWNLTMMPRNMSLADLRDNTIDANGNELKFEDEPASNNPYWTLNNLKNNDEKHHLISFISAKLELAKWLNLKIQSGFDFNNSRTHEHYAAGSAAPTLNIDGGMSNGFYNSLELNTDFMFTAKKEFSDKISTAFNLGGNNRYVTGSSMSNGGTGLKVPGFYSTSNIVAPNLPSSDFSEKAVRSLYSLSSFSYDQWFYFDLSLRNDWSSALPPKNNSYFYHSENLSLLFTKALGIQSDVLSNGRLRASYGKVGNDTGPYRINQYYGLAKSNWPFPMGTVGGLAPADLKPELTNSWEAGVNLGLFKNRIELDLTYYTSKTTNQIMNVTIPGTSGYTSKLLNAGEVNNSGMELLLNAGIIQKERGFNWDLSVNAARNNSKVVALYEGLDKISKASFFTGLSIEARPGQPFGVIYGSTYLRDSFGDRLIDDNGFPIKGDIKKLGDINPDLTGGITNKFSYKNFSLSFLIDFQFGGEFISGSKFYQYTMGTHSETLAGRDEWYSTHGADGTSAITGITPEGPVFSGININTGDPNTIPIIPVKYYTTAYNSSISEEFVLDATNARIREVVFTYKLPSKLLSKVTIKSSTLSLVGRNLLFLYRAQNYADPESGYSSGSTGNGIEHSPIPSTRFIGMQLKVDF